jgi:hypothetical protein
MFYFLTAFAPANMFEKHDQKIEVVHVPGVAV